MTEEAAHVLLIMASRTREDARGCRKGHHLLLRELQALPTKDSPSHPAGRALRGASTCLLAN